MKAKNLQKRFPRMRRLTLALALLFASAMPVLGDDEYVKFAKSLTAQQFDRTLPSLPIGQWLTANLPPGVEPVWGEHATDCGEQAGIPEIDRVRDMPLCAEIELKKSGESIGVLLLFVGTGKKGKTKEAGLYSGYFKQGDKTVVLNELRDIGKMKDDMQRPKPPYSAEQLRTWHKTMAPWPWLGQPEYVIHLRNEARSELLLAIDGYARGGTYILFVEKDGTWTRISDEIEQAHHPVHILTASREGWHDFETHIPAWGSGGAEVWVFTYVWKGNKYALQKRRDAKWCELETFRSDKNLCPQSR